MLPSLAGYGVTAQGDIISYKRLKPSTLSQQSDRDGYRYVILFEKGKRIKRLVHRLVAEAYLSPVPAGKVCAHLDGNPANNCVSNLVVCTQAENIAHKHAHGTVACGTEIGVSKLNPEKVRDIRQAFTGARGQLSALARQYGVSRPAIAQVIRRKTWRHI